MSPRPRKRPLLAGVGAALAFMYILMFGLLPLGSLCGVPLLPVVWYFTQGAAVRIFAVLALPWFTTFAHAAFDYGRADATVLTVGLPGPTFYSVDPDTGLERQSLGCTAVSFGPFVYNASLRWLVSTFGPIDGSYQGPFPSEADARAALHGASVATSQDGPADPERNPLLWPETPSMRSFRSTLLESLSARPLSTSATVWKGEVGLLRIADSSGHGMIAAIERSSGRVFAKYCDPTCPRTPHGPW